jgi:hypothetical protein
MVSDLRLRLSADGAVSISFNEGSTIQIPTHVASRSRLIRDSLLSDASCSQECALPDSAGSLQHWMHAAGILVQSTRCRLTEMDTRILGEALTVSAFLPSSRVRAKAFHL